MKEDCRYLSILFLIVLIKAALMLFVILQGGINLNVEEAQYWNWSRALDWGYYSKPAGIAYQTHLGTLLFGHTELGVRFVPLIIGTLFPFAIYFLGKSAGLSSKGAFYSALIFAFSLAGVFSTFIATTDSAFVFFWTLACIPIVYGLTQRSIPHYYLTAIAIILGAQFKWHIYELWLAIFLFAWLFPYIRSKHILGAFLVSLLGLLPSVWWNWAHNWPTFKHVWKTNIPHPTETTQHGNFWEFLGAQSVLLSPVFFVVFLFGLVTLYRNRNKISPGLLFCGCVSAIILGVFLTLSVFAKMQGNWCVYVYPTAAVVAGWFLVYRERRQSILLCSGLGVAVVIAVLVFSLPFIQSHNISPVALQVPFKSNMFKDFLGWENLGRVLKDKGYDPKKDYLVADRYQLTSVLGFYTESQKRAYFLNIHEIRKNQFSYWPSLADQQKGKDGFFVIETDASKAQQYLNQLKKYFNGVAYLGFEPIYESNGKWAKGILIFRTIGYNGIEPPSVDKY